MAHKIWPYEQIKGVFSSPLCLSFFFVVSVSVVFKLAIRKHKSKTKTNLNQLPSPPKLPIIGNLHQLGTLLHRSLQDLSLKYGDIMLLHLGQRQTPTLVVSSAEVAKEIMKTHDKAFSNRPHGIATKILFPGCTDVVFGNYGENWKQKRKISVVELLSMKSVQSFCQIRKEEAEEMVSKLHEASLNGSYVNLSEMILSTTSNIVCKCIMGRKFEDTNVKNLSRKILIHLSDFVVGDYFPWLGWIDIISGKIGEFKDTSRVLDGLFDQVIKERLDLKKKNIENNQFKSKGFLDILLQLQEDGMLGFELSNNDIKGILKNMFVGGTSTAGATIEWAISEIVRHPSIMKKAQEEVRRVVGHKSKVEESDVNQMHYLKCVLKETLRLHPPNPLLLPRETMSNVKLKGYDIPAKTMVHVNVWAIQRDPKIWENPEEFIPERFEHNQVGFKDQDCRYIPFGFGRRGCPGMNFGIVANEYVIASLLYWFDWKLPETNSGKQYIDMSEKYDISLIKKEPLQLKPIAFSF